MHSDYPPPYARAYAPPYARALVAVWLALASSASLSAASESARGAATGCPYQFGSAMPPETFCVYSGVARSKAGKVCDHNLVIIWSSYTDGGAGDEVYLGVVGDEDLVVRATSGPHNGRPGRAELIEYSSASSDLIQPLAGEASLSPSPRGADAAVLTLDLSQGAHLQTATGCPISAYSGKFMGVIGPPLATATSR